MQKQSRCYNPPPAPATWTQGILGEAGPLRERRGIPVERISPPTPPLLTYLVGNSHLPLGRLPPPTRGRTRTTNEVPGTAEDGDMLVMATPLPWVSISFPQKKGGTCPKSGAITAIRKNITPTSILGTQRSSQKTSVGLGNLHAGDWD